MWKDHEESDTEFSSFEEEYLSPPNVDIFFEDNAQSVSESNSFGNPFKEGDLADLVEVNKALPTMSDENTLHENAI